MAGQLRCSSWLCSCCQAAYQQGLRIPTSSPTSTPLDVNGHANSSKTRAPSSARQHQQNELRIPGSMILDVNGHAQTTKTRASCAELDPGLITQLKSASQHTLQVCGTTVHLVLPRSVLRRQHTNPKTHATPQTCTGIAATNRRKSCTTSACSCAPAAPFHRSEQLS